MVKFGIVGGTGFKVEETRDVETDYGPVSLGFGVAGGKEVCMYGRHGKREVGYLLDPRGVVQAMKEEGVRGVVAVSACGRLGNYVVPGHIVTPSDLTMFGRGGVKSFAHDGGLLMFIEGEPPFSEVMRGHCAEAWDVVKDEVEKLYEGHEHLRLGFHPEGYAHVNDFNQFAPKALEMLIRGRLGNVAVIGQTLWPENVMFKEYEIAVLGIAMCGDHSQHPLGERVVHATVCKNASVIRQGVDRLVEETIRIIPEDFLDKDFHLSLDHAIMPGDVDYEHLEGLGRVRLAKFLRGRIK